MSGQNHLTLWVEQLGDQLGLLLLEKPWSGCSDIMRSIVSGLAEEYKPRLKWELCDLDGHPDIAEAFQICELPTILFFQHGEIQSRFQGLTPRHELSNHIQKLLNGIQNLPQTNNHTK